MIQKICLLEDEKDLSQMLCIYLEKAGYVVHTCSTIAEAEIFLNKDIAVWVVDVMLPDGNGLELIKRIKTKNKNAFVIIISAKGDCFDRVAGFEMGCDDYIAKPFLPAELVFRVDKRKKQMNGQEEKTEFFTINDYEVNIAKRMIMADGKRIDITSREFDILLFFIRHKGQAISREQLLNQVWGTDYYGNDRIVDNYIKNIRRKLPKLTIETIYGYGYRYNI